MTSNSITPRKRKNPKISRRFLEMSMSRIKRMDDKEEDEDRISSLPDCVINIIFKFMEMREIVQTSVLSKRWRFLWKSTSHLNFNLHLSPLNESLVDRVLLLRNHTYDAHTFYLASATCHPTKLDMWVTYAMCRNVQKVTLVFVQISEPTVVALCGKLKRLILRNVDVVFEDYPYELLLSCPIMETLELGVSNSYQFDNLDYPIECCDIKLSAPNLKEFKFKECFSKNHTLENLSNLVIANIDVDVWADDEDAYYLDNLLGGLTNVESLIFSLNEIPAELIIPITLNKVATFQSLRYLKVVTYIPGVSSIFCFSTILKLLEKSPNVETLVLDGRLCWLRESDEEDMVAGLMSWCKLCHLKTLNIEDVLNEVSTGAFKFLECLMENATSLQNVVMTTIKTTREEENLVNLCKMLKVPPKMTIIASDRIGVSLKPSKKVHWETA